MMICDQNWFVAISIRGKIRKGHNEYKNGCSNYNDYDYGYGYGYDRGNGAGDKYDFTDNHGSGHKCENRYTDAGVLYIVSSYGEGNGEGNGEGDGEGDGDGNDYGYGYGNGYDYGNGGGYDYSYDIGYGYGGLYGYNQYSRS